MIKLLGLQPLHVLLYDFEMNSNQPKGDHAQWVEQYASLVRRRKEAPNTTVHRLIFLRGKACSQGQETHNLTLAMQRAQSVARIFENALKGYPHVVVPVTLAPQGNDASSRSVDVTVEELISVNKIPPPKPVTPTPLEYCAVKRFKIRIMHMETKEGALNFRAFQLGGGRVKATFEVVDVEAKMRAVYSMSQTSASIALKDDLMPVSASMDESGSSKWVYFTQFLYFPSKNDVEKFRYYRAGFDVGAFILAPPIDYLTRGGIRIDMREFYPDADLDRDLQVKGPVSLLGEEFELVRPAWPF